jgi:DHA2 family multidrug resistance protein
MSEATGLNNLVRQLGGSFGVAIFASLLGRFTNQAKSVLAAHVTTSDPAVVARLQMMKRALASGVDSEGATARAVRMMDGIVSGQAAMLAFERAFFLGGALFFLSIPIALLLDDGRHGKAESGSKEHMVVEV